MRISDWSSDVCSSDLLPGIRMNATTEKPHADAPRATFQTLEDRPLSAGNDVNLDVILDVPVTLSMQVGRARIPIRNLLQLHQGRSEQRRLWKECSVRLVLCCRLFFIHNLFSFF